MKIENAFSNLQNAFTDWKQFLYNKRFYKSNNCLSWYGYSKVWLSENVTADEFDQLLNDRQYSFQISSDDSLVQLYYQFNSKGRQLTGASLAYYKKTSELLNEVDVSASGAIQLDSECETITMPTEDESDTTLQEMMPLVSGVGYNPVSWIRIDYDPEVDKGVFHSSCHLHSSGFPGARVMLNLVPTPRQFLEFIFSLFYCDQYRRHRLDGDWNYQDKELAMSINSGKFAISNKDHTGYVAHISVPTNGKDIG